VRTLCCGCARAARGSEPGPVGGEPVARGGHVVLGVGVLLAEDLVHAVFHGGHLRGLSICDSTSFSLVDVQRRRVVADHLHAKDWQHEAKE